MILIKLYFFNIFNELIKLFNLNLIVQYSKNNLEGRIEKKNFIFLKNLKEEEINEIFLENFYLENYKKIYLVYFFIVSVIILFPILILYNINIYYIILK